MGMPRLTPWSLLLAALVQACASPEVPTARSDWVTESDESPARKRARLRLELATAYYQQGQDAVALDEVKQALTHDAGLAAGWNLRGLIYLRQQAWGLAQDSFERGLVLAPGDADLAHNLGWLLCQQSEPRPAEAERWLQRALVQARPDQSARTWSALALCQQRAGRPQEALASLAQSLAIAPGQPQVLWLLAQAQHAQALWPEAWDTLAQLHARQKPSAQSLWLAVRVARKLDNAEFARQAAQQLRQEFGRSPQAQALDKGWFDE